MYQYISPAVQKNTVILIIAFIFLAVPFTGTICGASVSGQNWPMYMNNAGRTGDSVNTLPPRTETAWKFSTGEMRLYAPPVVYDGVAYVLGQELFAVDACGDAHGGRLVRVLHGEGGARPPAGLEGDRP